MRASSEALARVRRPWVRRDGSRAHRAGKKKTPELPHAPPIPTSRAGPPFARHNVYAPSWLPRSRRFDPPRSLWLQLDVLIIFRRFEWRNRLERRGALVRHSLRPSEEHLRTGAGRLQPNLRGVVGDG